jgi:phage baseplate assembly protein V
MNAAADMLRRIGELERRINQMVVRGKVAEVDPKKQRVKVSYGVDLVSGWLPWKPIRTGKAVVWWCPEVGEGVTVISGGDVSLGEVFPGSYHDDFPAPSDDPDVFHVNFGDDSTIEYNRSSHSLDVVMKGDVTAEVDGKTKLTAKGGAKIIGDVEIDGKLDVTKDITGAAEVSDKTASMSKDRAIYNAHGHSYIWSDPGGSSSSTPPNPRQ